MKAIPKCSIMKVSTQTESLAASSPSSRRGVISRAQSGRHKISSNILRRLPSLRFRSPSATNTAAARGTHNNEATAPVNVHKKRRRVHFNTISIREYEIQPSDNPSSLFSPGLELGWNYNILVSSYSIDKFESQRVEQRQTQYHQKPLPMKHRRLLLHEFGFSQEEIEVASARARTLREERERSIERMNLDWCDRIIEDLGVSWSRVLKFSCKGDSVVDGVEESTVLHPSVLVDASVEASSFFEASLKEEQLQQVIVDDDAVATKMEEAPKDG